MKINAILMLYDIINFLIFSHPPNAIPQQFLHGERRNFVNMCLVRETRKTVPFRVYNSRLDQRA